MRNLQVKEGNGPSFLQRENVFSQETTFARHLENKWLNKTR